MDDKEYTYNIDKYTIGVDTNGEDGIGMTVAKIENGELHFLGNCYGENARCIDLLIKENQELKNQLEEWEHHLKCSKEMLDIQGQKGNYDYDEYMLGLYNGMEYIIALFETREPNYISGKDVEFTNNRTQQKEFIKYLENKIKYFKDLEQFAIKTFNNKAVINLDLVKISMDEDRIVIENLEEILRKYKSIIGGNKDE